MIISVYDRVVFVLLFLLCCSIHGASSACSSASYVDTYPTSPNYPGLSTSSLPGGSQPVPSTYNPLIEGHWSEVAKLRNYRAPLSYSVYVRSSCPHTQSGLRNWHDPTIWPGGVVPANGADVTIPTGMSVLVASCSVDSGVSFGAVTIPLGSSLVFGDADITFRATGFIVRGSLLVGSETCRIANKVAITLIGSRNAQSFPAPAHVKGISVFGTIGLHGAKYSPTWTRLAMTANPGDQTIFIQDTVNWQVGQTIVITTTEVKDSRDWHRNEERIITAILRTSLGAAGQNSVITAIQLNTPLDYKHFGGKEYQAEVALLSRNVVVQGDTNSLPTDAWPFACNNTNSPNEKSTFPCQNSYLTGFGGHIIVDGSTGTSPVGRFSGVEMYRVGQTNIIGRYPIHFHMLGDVTATNYANHYVTDSSVHDSYFRCYAIHGTHGVLLSENTAYNAIGHCYFLEDGVEENNTISYNQAALVHALGPYQNPSMGLNGDSWWSQYLSWYTNTTSLILPSDMAAGCFYFTNTYNDVVGNAASGGWAGYALPALAVPVKLHYGQNTMSPRNRPFRSPFRGNSAHSTGFWWNTAGGIYVGGELQQRADGTLSYTSGRSATHDTCSNKLIGLPGQTAGCWDLGQQMYLQFTDNKVFLANRGMQHWGERSEIIRFELHDVGLSMNVFGKVWIDSMLMECRQGNHNPTWFAGCAGAPVDGRAPGWGSCNVRDYQFFTGMGGFQWYDVGQLHILTNSTIRNCMNSWKRCVYGTGSLCNNVAAFTSLTHSDQFVPEIMQVTSGLVFENVSAVWQFSTATSGAQGVTVSGRLQNWFDDDGSAARIGGRGMIGSAWANEWWKYNDACTLENQAWKCRYQSVNDSKASFIFNWDAAQQANIGDSICINGGDGSKRCPVVAKATHFGRNESLGLDIGVNAKVSGPIIHQSGGWFVRFTSGTPRVLTMASVQVDFNETLLLAFPYPAGTTFSVYAQGATWCSTSWGTCQHFYRSVSSIDAVRTAFGDAYYWDNTNRVLYLRITNNPDSFGGRGLENSVWTPFPPRDIFERGGQRLFRGGASFVVIEASCGSAVCAPQPDVNVPPARFPPDSFTTSSITSAAAAITVASATTTSALNAATTSTAAVNSATTSAASNAAATTSLALNSATTSARNSATTSTAFNSATTSASNSAATSAALRSATTSALNSATTTSAFNSATTSALNSATTTSALNAATTSALNSATTTSALNAATTTTAAAARSTTTVVTSSSAATVASTSTSATTSSLTRATTAAAASSSTLSSATTTTVATSSSSSSATRASSTISTAATSSTAASTSAATSAATSSAASSSSSSRVTSAAATTAAATTTLASSSSSSAANNIASTSSSSSARVSTSTLSSVSAAASTLATTATTTAASTTAATTTTNAQTSSSSGRVTISTTSAQSTPTTSAVVVTSTAASTNAATTTTSSRSSASSTSAATTSAAATTSSRSTTSSSSSTTSAPSSTSSTTGSSSGGWPLLPGSVIGSPGSYANLGNNISKAYDTSFTTFYDAATASGSWVGLNLGSTASIKQIHYAARNGFTGRMLGGTFQASNTASFSPSSRVVTLYTIPTNERVPTGSHATQTITVSGSYQFVRYYGPNGGYCNVAEIAFRGVRSATASVATTMSSAPITRRSITQISNNNNSTVPGFDINAYSALVATAMGVDPSMLFSIIQLGTNSTAPFKVITTVTSENIFNSTMLSSQLIVALNDPTVQTFLASSGFLQMGGSTQEEVDTPNPAPASDEVYTLTPEQAEADNDDVDADGDTPLIIGADSASPFGPLTLASLIGIVVGGAVFVIVIVVVVVIVVKKKKTHSKAIDLSIF
eukprot:TRINITY_DN614_c0_g1_i1.p1 TRINITY_DN614_c0_g1~~TRINITY_DN614_c0_g1_i1.p1  ORF type:complete len:1844 (-),score=383.73 TRINITY_DN614_c0_g1_i1:116-5647(-)